MRMMVQSSERGPDSIARLSSHWIVLVVIVVVVVVVVVIVVAAAA
jgi:hypothetical protein